MSVIKKETIDVRRIGTALIGGDFTGNARGTNAVDIQSNRTAATQVASGINATAIGRDNTASDYYTTAIGYNNNGSNQHSTTIGSSNTASAAYGTAIGYSNSVTGKGGSALGFDNTVSGYYATASGYQCTASGYYSSAFGYQTTASAYYSTALGYQAVARIQKTVNICGPQIIRKDNGEAVGAAFESFCGVEDILVSKEVDLKAVADQTITLPANCHFWLNEVGIIATNIAGLVAQPTVRYGITGDLDKHGAAAATTALTATNKREIETPLVPEDGETSLTGGVTIAANADTFNGRFYWKGMLVEDE